MNVILNQNPEISVVIPAYNAESTITTCLASLKEQTLPDTRYEILVVDDGSSDKTSSIVKDFKDVKLIPQENAGPASARNRGILVAKGNFIVFTDSDCELDSRFLEEIIKPFANKTIVGAQGRYKTKQTSTVALFCQYEITERYRIYQRRDYIAMLGTYAAAYRSCIFQQYGMFDTRFPMASGEDFAFSGHLFRHGQKMVFAPNAVCYHQHPDSLQNYLKQKFFRGYWRNLFYRENRTSAVNDGYTPHLLKLQTLLSFFTPAILFVALITGITRELRPSVYLVGIWALVFNSFSFPLFISILRHSPKIAAISLVYAFLRAHALAAGVAAGVFLHLNKANK